MVERNSSPSVCCVVSRRTSVDRGVRRRGVEGDSRSRGGIAARRSASWSTVRVEGCCLACICAETQQREGAAAALQQLRWRTKRK